jgi:hypothetical protein
VTCFDARAGRYAGILPAIKDDVGKRWFAFCMRIAVVFAVYPRIDLELSWQ